MAVTMKNAVFWDVMPCGSCISLQRVSVASYCNVVPSSPILVTLMMEVIYYDLFGLPDTCKYQKMMLVSRGDQLLSLVF
jgi:hypothetical protein